MSFERERTRCFARTSAELRVVLGIMEAANNRVGKLRRFGICSRREMTVHAVGEPVGNPAHRERGGRDPEHPGFRSGKTKGLGPDAWHDQEVCLGEHRPHVSAPDPADESNVDARRFRFDPARSSLEVRALGTFAGNGQADVPGKCASEVWECLEQSVTTL